MCVFVCVCLKCIYVVHGSVINDVPKDCFFTMVNLMNLYIEQGEPVGAYDIKEFWTGVEDVECAENVLKWTKEKEIAE